MMLRRRAVDGCRDISHASGLAMGCRARAELTAGVYMKARTTAIMVSARILTMRGSQIFLSSLKYITTGTP